MRNSSTRRGASAIEFALTLPIILVIFSGIIEYGWVFFQQSAALGAVRDGVRLGVTYATDADPEGAAAVRTRAVLSGYGLECGEEDASCVVTATVFDDGVNYATMSVNVQRDYTPMFDLLPTPAHINAEMTMVMEDQD